MKRAFDLIAALSGLVVFSPALVFIAVAVRVTSRGPVLHWSRRVGQHNRIFEMPKFRTMYVGTPQVATHLLTGADSHITPLGRVLRKSSLDELPQLWSVLVGDMSVVGPRPALFNQDDLVDLRTACGAHQLKPGITGWAQVNGRDELTVEEKAAFDEEYLHHLSMLFDFKIIISTVLKVSVGDGVKQADPICSPAADDAGRKVAA